MKSQNRKFTKFISLLKFPGLQYKTKKRMKEEDIEKGDYGAANPKSFLRFLSDLNQAVPDHLADASQTR